MRLDRKTADGAGTVPGSGTATCRPFGAAPDGTPVERWTLRVPGGSSACILTYGATLQTLRVPDRAGVPGDVVLSLPTVEAYARHDAYLGALVGRYANRIAGGRFVLDGVACDLDRNEGGSTLHGGTDGFHRRVWAAHGFSGDDHAGVVLKLRSLHGDMGFPGTLDVEVTYRLESDAVSGSAALRVEYRGVTDRPTVVNLTQHAYFNLQGAHPPGTVGEHELAVRAEAFLPTDGRSIPVGPEVPVAGTPFELDGGRPLGEVLAECPGAGINHCYVLPGGRTALPRLAARLAEPTSGRVMETWTTEPGLQVYTANHLAAPFVARGAVCLETQNFPDAPNREEYPSAVLRPGEEYRSVTEYRFRAG